MLHEIAASDLEITNIVNPLRKLLRKVEVVVGDVNQIDLPNKHVLISRGFRNQSQQLDYDHLVMALGSVTNFYDLPGLAELAVPMKSLQDAVRLRAQILRHLEEANSESDPAERRSLLTLVVAGGGFAGVETLASLNDFGREVLPFYPNLSQDMLRPGRRFCQNSAKASDGMPKRYSSDGHSCCRALRTTSEPCHQCPFRR